ncbi:protein of unknown function [Methylocaldum szegediense]|uniref:Uncharacterized protein n=1 Tax=Methylocaldum szegediense TaxID=73780 RepID=A0ABN8X4P0_9GAMM|nr:protein of unknown function [Methylocaldum szegediense]
MATGIFSLPAYREFRYAFSRCWRLSPRSYMCEVNVSENDMKVKSKVRAGGPVLQRCETFRR